MTTLLFNLASFAQNHEVKLNFCYGVSQDHFSVQNSDKVGTSLMEMRNLLDRGLNIDYKYLLWKKHLVYVAGGIEFSEAQHYYPIIDGKRHVANINIKKERLAIFLGAHKQFKLYDDRLRLELGWKIKKNLFRNLKDVYSAEMVQSEQDWIKYSYQLITYQNSDEYYTPGYISSGAEPSFHTELELGVKFRLKRSLFLDFGISYSRRNIFFYDVQYSVYNYFNDGQLNYSYTYAGLAAAENEKFGVKDHYIYTNFGLSYQFNWNN